MSDSSRNDPVLRLLPDEVPPSFLALPPEEQAWRGRYFLMTWALHEQHAAFAWSAALANSPEHVKEAKLVVSEVRDEDIINSVAVTIDELRRMRLEDRGETV